MLASVCGMSVEILIILLTFGIIKYIRKLRRYRSFPLPKILETIIITCGIGSILIAVVLIGSYYNSSPNFSTLLMNSITLLISSIIFDGLRLFLKKHRVK